ncbi:MAG: TadE/TadG family type IV pilus assembly protein, partial [Pseudomonadota bacterium]
MLKTFRRDEEGAVSVEFVLVFPVLCLLLLASYVFFDIFKSESTAAKAVYTVSDILSRQEEVDTGFVQDLYVLLDKLEPMASDNKWMRVTSAVFDGTSYNVDWSQVVNPAPGTADVLNTTTALTNGTLPLAILPQVAP